MSRIPISFFSLYSDDDDTLWEPFNTDVLAQYDVELTEDDWDDLKEAREDAGETSIEKSEDEENDEDGEICPEKVPLTLRC